MSGFKKIAMIFPGQGAQYVGMGKGFFHEFPIARQTFDEADDLLRYKLTQIAFEGPAETLVQTKHSQLALFTMSIAILRVIHSLFPEVFPTFTAGLSLGEYSAITAAEVLPFTETLDLVKLRSTYMNDACEMTQGAMAVVLGLDSEQVEKIVEQLELPNDLWAANFNCPGQVVISGTVRGIEVGTKALLEQGAKRVLPLQVHGAFHSGLMASAEHRLAHHITQAPFKEGRAELIMNVTGKTAESVDEIKKNLIKQVTHPVRWEQSMRHLEGKGTDLYLEIGCGKTLAGFHKRIGCLAPIVSIDVVNDLKQLEQRLEGARS